MKKNICIVAALFFVGIFSMLVTYKHYFMIADLFEKSNVELTQKNLRYKDDKGNLYYIYKNTNHLVKLDSEGNIIWNYPANDKNSYFVDLTVDEDGIIYALGVKLDDAQLFIKSEFVEKINPNILNSKKIYTVNRNKKENLIRSGKYKNIEIVNGNIILYQINKKGFEIVKIKNKIKEKIIEFDFNENMYISNIIGYKPGDIYFYTQKSELYKVNSSGEKELIYSKNMGEKYEVILSLNQNKQYLFLEVLDNSLKRKIVKISKNKYIQKNILESGRSEELTFVDEEGNIYLNTNSGFAIYDKEGKLINEISEIKKNSKFYTKRFLILIIPLIGIWAIIYACYYIYKYIMQKWISIIFRQVLIFIPIFIISFLAYVYPTFMNYIDTKARDFEKAKFRDFEYVVRQRQQNLDINTLNLINGPSDYEGIYYKNLKESLDFKNYNWPFDVTNFYNVVYKIENGYSYKIADDDDNMQMAIPRKKDIFGKTLNGEIISGVTSDEKWIYSLGPIYDNENNLIAVYQTGMSYYSFLEKDVNELLLKVRMKIYIIGIFMLIIIAFTSYRLLYSLKKLNYNVELFSKNQVDGFYEIKRKDEIWNLNIAFKKMSENIKKHIDKLTLYSKSYYRFVPQKYLEVLKKDSILDVNLGDYSKVEMEIMHVGIHDFFKFTEAMTEIEKFKFINKYLKEIGPFVKQNKGIIDSYLANGMVALFNNEERMSIDTAIKIIQGISKLNERRKEKGREEIDLGIAIHKGSLIIGIIGENDRIQQTIISDDSSNTRKIQEFTKNVNSKILITEEIFNDLKEDLNIKIRYIGIMELDEGASINIYDIYEVDDEDIVKLKEKTKYAFEEGINLYQNKKFYEARSKFIQVLKLNQMDYAARIYFYLSDYYLNNEPNDGFKPYINNRIKDTF